MGNLWVVHGYPTSRSWVAHEVVVVARGWPMDSPSVAHVVLVVGRPWVTHEVFVVVDG